MIFRKNTKSRLRNRRHYKPFYFIEKTDRKFGLQDLLLVFVGALVGVVGNQFFYDRNKLTDARIDLQREFAKAQLPILNRILNFTYKYDITITTYVGPLVRVVRTREDTVVISADATLVNGTFDFVLPTFVANDEKRNEIIEDINEIKKNRENIELDIWEKFERLYKLIVQYPLPKNSSIPELLQSNWLSEDVRNEWQKRTTDLFNVTYQKLNNPFD